MELKFRNNKKKQQQDINIYTSLKRKKFKEQNIYIYSN